MNPNRIPKSLRTLRGLNLINLAQLSAEQVGDIVHFAYAIKHGRSRQPQPLRGKSVALLFANPSTRTRLAIHTAVTEDGGSVIDLGGGGTHLGVKETLADTARTVAQFCSAVTYRGVAHQQLEEICRVSTIPVVNALTSQYHPTQALADLLTIYEQFGRLRGIRVAYLGDCDNNIARSLALAAVQSGLLLTLAAPPGYQLDERAAALCEALSPHHADLPVQTDDPTEAVRGADAIYTDVWYSMGDEAEQAERTAALQRYQVNEELFAGAATHAVCMHCLPANRGDEVSGEVIDGPRSVVWRQAGNRRYVFKALLRAILRDE